MRVEVDVDAQSTLAAMVAGEWASDRLQALGYPPLGFPWRPQGKTRVPMTSDLLAVLKIPFGPNNEVFRLDEVAAQLIESLGGDVGFGDLSAFVESLYVEHLATPSRSSNPLESLVYLGDGSVDVLAQLQQLRGSPQSVAVSEITGSLVRIDEETWGIQTAGGNQYRLAGSRQVAEVEEGEVTVSLVPYELGTLQVVEGSQVRTVGGLQTGGRKSASIPQLEVFSIEVVETNLLVWIIDEDLDGLEDGLEYYYFNSIEYGFWDDPDGDLFSIAEEFRAGTDPSLAAFFPAGSPAWPQDRTIDIADDGTVTLSWLGSSSANYAVQSGLDLGAWSDSAIAPVEEEPGSFIWTLPTPDPALRAQFFRIGVSLPPIP